MREARIGDAVAGAVGRLVILDNREEVVARVSISAVIEGEREALAGAKKL